MNLQLDPSVAGRLRSPSQIARLITEDWASRNLFCIACSSTQVTSEPANTPVRDYKCPECDAIFQLKSKQGHQLWFGSMVTNSAYDRKLAAIRAGAVPHYAFLEYSKSTWTVDRLFVVPGYFISPAVIQQRAPLAATARRAGWVGSNILLGQLPAEARVSVVDNGTVRDIADVRSDWRRFDFLGSDPRASAGWGAQALNCVKTIQAESGEQEFTLQGFYSRFEAEFFLSALNPDNHNIASQDSPTTPSLRDGGVIGFLGKLKGRYRITY